MAKSSDRLRPAAEQDASPDPYAAFLKPIMSAFPPDDGLNKIARGRFQREVAAQIGMGYKPEFDESDAAWRIAQGPFQSSAIQNNPTVGEHVDALVQQYRAIRARIKSGEITDETQITYDPNQQL